MTIEQDIAQIKLDQQSHNLSDTKQFDEINRKLDEERDIHIRNEENIKNILAQTTKTNGRVTNLESLMASQDKTIALLSQIVSQQHNQYEKFVIQQEKLKDKEEGKFVTEEEFDWVRKLVYGTVTLILISVFFFAMASILHITPQITL